MTIPTATGQPAAPRQDSQQIRRSLARFIGCGYVAYFVIVAIDIALATTATVPAWWTPVALTVVFLPGWLMLATSFFSRAARLTTQVLPACCGLGYVLATGSWFLVWTGTHTASSTGTWLVTFPGLAALALVVSSRPWLSLVHLGVALPAVQIANSWARSAQYGQLPITDITWGMVFSSLFVLAGLMAVRTGDQLDKTYTRTLELAEKSARQHERETQRKLYSRLIHDSVLAVMRDAPRANDDPVIGRDARETLRDWAGWADERSSKQPMDHLELLQRLRAVVTKAHPDATIAFDEASEPDRATVVPMRVGLAFADAAGEAVRNARRYSGPNAAIIVTARLDSLPLRVRICNDGPGFDPSTIAPTSLGLTHSITERMSDVSGHAFIHSAPGSGTTVELLWPH